MRRPTLADVRAAVARVPAEVQGTPCVEAPWLSSGRGHTVWLKVECLQPTHSFKVRGAANAVAAIVEQQAAPCPRHGVGRKPRGGARLGLPATPPAAGGLHAQVGAGGQARGHRGIRAPT